jgi:Zn-dependent M28 family amino/carboxypeptidase
VAFVNEEPPYFHSSDMGSLVYALDLAAKEEKVYCMICLEMLGCFSDEPGSQQIPAPLHLVFNHTRGDFIGFTSNDDSKEALKDIVGRFRNYAHVPSEGLAAPPIVPGLSYSDHWSFWQAGYKAIMVTDTAFMRYPYYHTEQDTMDKIDFTRFTKVVLALSKTILELALEREFQL